MPTKTAALTLAFAVAFLAAANVNAGMLSTADVDAYGAKNILKTVNLVWEGSTFTVKTTIDGTETSVPLIPDSGLLSLFGENYWTLSNIAPAAYDYFSLTGPDASTLKSQNNSGPMNLSINGGSTVVTSYPITQGSSTSYYIAGTSYFDDQAGTDGNWTLAFVTGGILGYSSAGYPNLSISFYGAAPDSDEGAEEGVAAPEPATLAVLGLGLAGLGLVSRRRRK